MKPYNPAVTAIQRNKLSAPMQYLLDHDLLYGRILDYGAGRGSDVSFLSSVYNLNAKAYDKYNILFNNDSLLDEEYDTVTCLYVFNVIPTWTEFYSTLDKIIDLGMNVYVAVRADTKAIKPTWNFDSDCYGYWTNNSFQRFYDKEEVEDQFGKNVNILTENSNFVLFQL